MITIKNFDTRNTLSAYTLGDVCSFYLRNNNISSSKTFSSLTLKHIFVAINKSPHFLFPQSHQQLLA